MLFAVICTIISRLRACDERMLEPQPAQLEPQPAQLEPQPVQLEPQPVQLEKTKQRQIDLKKIRRLVFPKTGQSIKITED